MKWSFKEFWEREKYPMLGRLIVGIVVVSLMQIATIVRELVNVL